MLAAATFFSATTTTSEIFSVDGIVPINILFKLHAFERTVESGGGEGGEEGIKQAVTEHNLWFLLAYLVMVKCLIGNLSNFT